MKKYFIPVISIIVLIFGCKKDPLPISAFTVEPGDSRVGTKIFFHNNSKYADSYEWDFGDGSKSQEINPNHTYTSYGLYGITMRATGAGGTNSATDSIFILPHFYGVSGVWKMEFTLNDDVYSGILMLYQQNDNSIKGNFTWSDNSDSYVLMASSKIEDKTVMLEWMIANLKLSFQGSVNTFFDLMNGLYYVNANPVGGTFSASRILK